MLYFGGSTSVTVVDDGRMMMQGDDDDSTFIELKQLMVTISTVHVTERNALTCCQFEFCFRNGEKGVAVLASVPQEAREKGTRVA